MGLVYGTFGIIPALTCGGLLGGFMAAKYGLKKMLPIMVGSMYLPKLAFIFLSFTQPENFLVVCGAIAVEQFGYGFGFTAFMLYLLYLPTARTKRRITPSAPGFMALGMMIPGMWSGWVADHRGLQTLFCLGHFFGAAGFDHRAAVENRSAVWEKGGVITSQHPSSREAANFKLQIVIHNLASICVF